MKQLFYIISREILVKFKSRSYYLFALTTPLLFVLPTIFTALSGEKSGKAMAEAKLGVVCNSFPYDTLEYRNMKIFAIDEKDAKNISDNTFDFNDMIGVIDMKDASFANMHEAMSIQVYAPESNESALQQHIADIESFVNSEYVYQYGLSHNANEDELLALTNFVRVTPVFSNAQASKRSQAQIMAFGLGMLLYIMFILFNNNIVKSISEERSNKLAEVMSMFVNPGKLMIGKITGLALASLVQLVVWIFAFTAYNKLVAAIAQHLGYSNATANAYGIDFSSFLLAGPFLGWLLMFFMLGILLNGAMSTIFAICSSSKGSSVPMILSNMLNLLSIYFCMYAASNPDSSTTTFASYFPLTSYLVMPAILPFGLTTGHIIVSAVILVAVSTVLLFMTGKLYRRFLV